MFKTLSVIIPAYNEEKTLSVMIEKVKAAPLPGSMGRELVVVNDGSTDHTQEVLIHYQNDPALKIVHFERNRGKAAAIKEGLKIASGEIIIIQDADLEYSPDDYLALLNPLLTEKAQVVYGSRFKGTIYNMRLINRAANLISCRLFNLLFHARLTDVNTCYKVFPRAILNKISITSERFAFETEFSAKCLRLGYTIQEVPIHYNARSKNEGKKITWGNALQMFCGIIKFRFSSLD